MAGFSSFLAARHASCFSSGLALFLSRKEIRKMAQTRGVEGRTSNRGFASMNQERQRQIASMGGKAVPDSKRSFSQNRDLAAQAGRKGGQSVPGEKRSFSQNRELAAQAGRKGGQSVPDEKRSFSQNPGLAAQAGRKGGQASHSAAATPEGADDESKMTTARRAGTPR
jgi:general stress protein YciG